MMRVSRLYTPKMLNIGQKINLEKDNAHYVRTVLRLKMQQSITLFNSLGGEYLCTISEVNRKGVVISINEFIDRSVESPLNITMGLGISRGDKMDWAVQKSVEMGVNNITPIITERCVIKFKPDKKDQKLQHWRNIVQHATEQSSRTMLPKLSDIENLSSWIEKQKDLKIFLDPYAENSLNALKPESKHITLLSGPEGGFSDQERELAVNAGFTPIRLGKRILRTETASLAALSAIQMLWGDYI